MTLEGPVPTGKATEPKGASASGCRLGAHSPAKDQELGSGTEGDSYRLAPPLAGSPERGWGA